MDFKKIKQVGREVGLSERRIREYERVGLIRPLRESRTNDRLFGPVEIAQLNLLRRLVNEHKFTLDNIKLLFSYAPCWELTGCRDRDRCPAPRKPTVPCYSVPDTLCGGEDNCPRCPIYLSKEKPRQAVVLPPNGNERAGSNGKGKRRASG
jgi:hypothetical protein